MVLFDFISVTFSKEAMKQKKIQIIRHNARIHVSHVSWSFAYTYMYENEIGH